MTPRDRIPHSVLPTAEIGTALRSTYVYFVILDGVQHRTFSSNEYVEALEHAAQLDFIYNSPELNDGIQGNHVIKLLTLPEMMMSDVEMVI